MTGATRERPLTAAQRQLVLDQQGMVRRSTRFYANRYRGVLSRDQIVKILQLALAEAARTFDPTLGVSFASSAWLGIGESLADAAERASDADAPLRKVLAACASLESGEVDLDEDEPAVARRAEATAAHLAAAWTLGTASEPAPAEGAELRRLMETSAATLPERGRRVMEMFYREGKSLREVSEGLGVSYATVRRDHQEALDAVKRECDGARS